MEWIYSDTWKTWYLSYFIVLERQQETINKILRFLASVFSKPGLAENPLKAVIDPLQREAESSRLGKWINWPLEIAPIHSTQDPSQSLLKTRLVFLFIFNVRNDKMEQMSSKAMQVAEVSFAIDISRLIYWMTNCISLETWQDASLIN